MRLAIATSTGPADWGLPIDWDTMATFRAELELQAALAEQQIANATRGR